MAMHIKIDNLIDGINKTSIIPFKELKFNGGEQHITIDDSTLPSIKHKRNENVIIEVSLTSSEKVMKLLLATDALRRLGYKNISLFSPYIPYSRQDRVCNYGEPLSAKVFCDLINSQDYNTVWTLDNHSDVTSALLKNVCEIDVAQIIMRITSENSIEKGEGFARYALVSPDAGALKRTYKLSKAMGGVPVIECGKIRDVKDGKILKTKVYSDHVLSRYERVLIVDDICDGGMTFIELAKELKSFCARKIDLYVSHGIFSRGLKVFDGLIENIYTTKSFLNNANVVREGFLNCDLQIIGE